MSGRAGPRPVYQIDFTAVACGKRVAVSKRRVRWRFGFANAQALAAGRVGTDCRGDEHDVTFVWSISSGKRVVLYDGQEVHYSSSRSGIFDYSWTMKGTNHVLKIVAHANPPLSPTPGFRQYDFFVDGLTFFRFPKVFRLGMSANDPRASATSPREHALAVRGNRYSNPNDIPVSAEAPSNPDEEEAYLQEAIRQSLEEDNPRSGGAAAASPVTDLLGFDAPAPPALPPSTTYVSSTTNYAGPPQQMVPYQGHAASETPFGYAPGPLQPTSAFSPATVPPQDVQYGATSDPWAASPAPPTASSAYSGYSGQQQPVANQLVVAPPSAAPYGGFNYSASVASNIGFGQPNVESQVSPAQSGGAPMTGYPMQQQPSVNSSFAASGAGQTDGSGYAASYPSSQWTPPAPIMTGPYGMPEQYATKQQDVPSAITPQGLATPSTLGFGSPAADFGGASSPTPAVPAPAPEVQSNQPEWEQQQLSSSQATELFTTEGAADVGGEAPEQNPSSLVDQAYSKLVDFESFSISSKKDAPRSNPFEMSSTVGGTKSLADIKASKAQGGQKKEVMKTPMPAPSPAVNGMPQQAAAQQPLAFGQQPAAQTQPFGQPWPHDQNGYGQMQQPFDYSSQPPQSVQPMSQQQYGQPPYTSPPMQQPAAPPAFQQGYGQATVSQQTAPMIQQPNQQSFGQTPMMQQPIPQSFGQAPMMHPNQNPFGQQTNYF